MDMKERRRGRPHGGPGWRPQSRAKSSPRNFKSLFLLCLLRSMWLRTLT
jgi:hypothetical protein